MSGIRNSVLFIKGTSMKKLLLASAMILGLSTVAYADTHILQTKKHNIRMICNNGQNCIYQSWNRPKRIGQGSPDFQMVNGNPTGNGGDDGCTGDFLFKKSDTKLILNDCTDKITVKSGRKTSVYKIIDARWNVE